MGQITFSGSTIGNALSKLLCAPDIEPGDQPSYETAKTIWLYHPLGRKMVEQPIEMAQSQEREIAVPGPGEERISEAFRDEWERICADGIILNAMATARAYGVSTLALMIEGTEPSTPVDWKKLADLTISF